MTLKLVLSLLTFLTVTMTFLPLIRNDFWIFRVLEYLRLQKLILAIIVLFTITGTVSILENWFYWLVIPLVISVLYLLTQVYPYTPLSKKEMHRTKTIKPDAGLKLF